MIRGLFAALALCACAGMPDTHSAMPKALFVIVDGIPADVVERVDTPSLDAIAGVGGYTRSWVGGLVGAESESPTMSAVGYNSLLTGTWANKHNVYDNDIKSPDYSYPDVFRIVKRHDPAMRTAIFSTWTDNRTKLLAGGPPPDFAVDGFELDHERFPPDRDKHHVRKIDEHVSSEAAKHVLAEAPDISWVYLEYPDDVGHAKGDSRAFDQAVMFADALVGRIWQAVQARAASTGEDWLVLVTTDHGRNTKAITGRDGHRYVGRGHGGQSARERTTWIATNSRRLNERFRDNPPIVDVLPSLLAHLRIPIPDEVEAHLDGQSFIRGRDGDRPR